MNSNWVLLFIILKSNIIWKICFLWEEGSVIEYFFF